METMTHSDAKRSSDFEISDMSTVAEAEQPRRSPGARQSRRDAEPPELGLIAREAPEIGSNRPPEAPDAGRGGDLFDDHELRHGRSRS
jgi:hypothetical protein